MTSKNSDVRARFAHRLRAIRIPRGYKTARSFAHALDIDENRYTRYERAEVEPDLQLLLRICDLLGASPNDLLCDTIGMAPVEYEMNYGFHERTAQPYHASVSPQRTTAPVIESSLDDNRKAAAWELATLIDELEARANHIDPAAMGFMDKLRRVAPIHAEIIADVYAFLQALPDRLQGFNLDAAKEAQIVRLTQEIIATGKSASNGNGSH